MPEWVRRWEQRMNERDREARAKELLLREFAAVDRKRRRRRHGSIAIDPGRGTALPYCVVPPAGLEPAT